MESRGTRWFFLFGDSRVQYSMEHFYHLKWRPPNSMESHGTRWFFYLAAPEFHGIPWNIPCKSRVTWYWLKWQFQSSREFQGTEWYFIWRCQSFIEFHGIFHGIPWNTCVIWNGALLIPWNPMEIGDFLFGDSRVPWNSMEYHMEFLGNIALNKMTISKFHGIPWN